MKYALFAKVNVDTTIEIFTLKKRISINTIKVEARGRGRKWVSCSLQTRCLTVRTVRFVHHVSQTSYNGNLELYSDI